MSTPRAGKRRWRLILAVGLAAILGLIAAGLGFLTYEVQQVPEFYQQAIVAPVVEQQQAAEHFEQQALELRNQIRRDDDWRLELTAEEVNGWLATVLPEKFANLLPPEISEPRVAVEQDRLHLAARYHTRGVTTVVSIELSAFLTKDSNVVAVRIHKAAAGNVPLPLGQYLEQITSEAAKRGVYVRWQEIAGDPQAIVTLPLEAGDKRQIVIRSLELKPGELIATGTAAPEEKPPANLQKPPN